MLVSRHLLPVLLNLDRLCLAHLSSFKLVLELAERHPEHGFEVAHKPIHVSFARHFVNDVLVIVVPEASAELFIVHLWLVLAGTPATSHLLRVNELELPLATSPSDTVLTVPISEELQQELPELNGP